MLSIMSREKDQTAREKAIQIFKDQGGILRTKEALDAGIHPRILYELRDAGILEKLETGLYCLAGLPGVSDPDLVTVAKSVPEGVVCLISALYFHQLTVQIPRCIHIAVSQDYKAPKISYPPVRFYWFSEKTLRAGVEEHIISGVRVKVFSKEKTVVDCFRHRSKVGIDVAIEALKDYLMGGKYDIALLMKLAKVSRAENVIRPYLDALSFTQS